MGQKVHPHGFRIGYLYGWESRWYAGKHYTQLLHEDLNVRRTIERMLPGAGGARGARSVADQLERRVSHRRAMKQAVLRATQRGALGIKIKVSGRLGGGEMSRKDKDMVGRGRPPTPRGGIA